MLSVTPVVVRAPRSGELGGSAGFAMGAHQQPILLIGPMGLAGADDQSSIDAATTLAIDLPVSCWAGFLFLLGRLAAQRQRQPGTGLPHLGVHGGDPRRGSGLRRRCPIASSPRLKVNGSSQLDAIGFPLLRALPLAEHIPTSAAAPIFRHGTGWAGLLAVGHG